LIPLTDQRTIGHKATIQGDWLIFEHMTCPNLTCPDRQTPTCEKDCDLYQDFLKQIRAVAIEVF